jgi:hypothetical protein
MLRKLRISFSILCGILCLLLIALWVRSFCQHDVVSGPALPTLKCGAMSLVGRLIIGWSRRPPFPSEWELRNHAARREKPFFRQPKIVFGFGAINTPIEQAIILPHWFLIAITATFAVAPWRKLSWRFSLRTLLIATTLVAAVLGLIFAASR